MRMGNLALIGAWRPENFFHLVLDNEVPDSTGGQATVSRGVSFGAIARACGYDLAFGSDSLDDLGRLLSGHRPDSGSTLVHFRIRPGVPASLARPKISPSDVLLRLMRNLEVAPVC